ncbi:PsiF family protein [Janthinobacterium aquaticum]|uniref:PsiF family protein n=1 Tax=Janthinobacterium sp. FT58W TaxID=2654254 RepID=UPI0012642C13|nr:PsiF family protein [Janthinobacterium sp. FT58W]KAB8042122.1 phosphate starvation-inducible protein PsiF [Janthinobacterium sp. FT58W]
MKTVFTASIAATLLAVCCSAAVAADAPKAANSQQSKMATCNADASGKKGDERKAFMKECLSAKAAPAPTQQTKMKTCNADAKDMKGDARKAFMKECLSAPKK